MGGGNMNQDEFIKKYNELNNDQKHIIEVLISSFQTAQTYHLQEAAVLEKDGCILNKEQSLPIEDCLHQKDS